MITEAKVKEVEVNEAQIKEIKLDGDEIEEINFQKKARKDSLTLLIKNGTVPLVIRRGNKSRVTARLYGTIKMFQKVPSIEMRGENILTFEAIVPKDEEYNDLHLEVILPNEKVFSSISIVSITGNVNVESVMECNDMCIENETGDTVVEEACHAYTINVKAIDGNINVDNCCKNLDLSTETGDITTYIRAKRDDTKICIKSESGNICLRMSMIANLRQRIKAPKEAITSYFSKSNKGFSACLSIKAKEGEVRIL